MIKCNLKATKKGLEIKDLTMSGEFEDLIFEAERAVEALREALLNEILERLDISEDEKEIIKGFSKFMRTKMKAMEMLGVDEANKIVEESIKESLKKMPEDFQEDKDIQEMIDMLLK